MKQDIHPQYVVTEVSCSCGNSFTTRSTARNGVIHVETCNVCHPFYTGKQRVLDTAGRVAKFRQKYAKVGKPAAKKATATDGAAKKATVTKGTAKKAAATKSTATKSTATKSTATKSTATEAAAAEATATKAAGKK